MGAILATIFTLVIVAISSIAVVNPNLNLSNLTKAASPSCLDPCTNNSDCGSGNYCYKPASGCPMCKKTIKPTVIPTPKKPTTTPSPTTSPQTLLIQKKACELEGGTWQNNKCIDSHEITSTPSPTKTPTSTSSSQCIKSGEPFSSSIPCCSSLVKVVTPYGTICHVKGTDCVEGAKKCQVGANNTYFEYKCDSSGYYQQDKRCDFGCNGNTCKTQQCTPGEKKCDNNMLKTCNIDGSAWKAEYCPNGCDNTNKICKPTPTEYCSNHQLLDCSGGCNPTTTGGTCITITPFCSSGNLNNCKNLCTPSLGGGSCPASTQTTCDGKPNGTSECTVNHDSYNNCKDGIWTNIKCPSGYFCPTGGTSCNVSCIPEKKLIYGCGHGIPNYGEFTVVYRETKEDCTTTEYPEVSDTCIKKGELLTESLGKTCQGNEDCNGGYCYNDATEVGLLDIMGNGNTCHLQSATSYRRQNLEAQNEGLLEVVPYFAAIPLAYFAGPEIINIAEGNLSSIPTASYIYGTNALSKLPTWTGTVLEAAGSIPAAYQTTKCNLGYCSPEEQAAAQETAFYTALGIQQVLEGNLASNIKAPKPYVGVSNFDQLDYRPIGGGFFGSTYLDTNNNTLIKTFNKITPNDMNQLNLYQNYGGKTNLITYGGDVTNAKGEVIGFVQNYVDNSTTLGRYVDSGGKFTIDEIDKAVSDLMQTQIVTGQAHGDLFRTDRWGNYGNLHPSNILVQTNPAGGINIIPIDYGGYLNFAPSLGFQNTSPEFMQLELDAYEKGLMQFIQ